MKNEPFLLALPAVALLQRPPGRDRERTAHHAAQASPQKINKKVLGSFFYWLPLLLLLFDSDLAFLFDRYRGRIWHTSRTH